MNCKLVLGIVLVALLALTGVVSAAGSTGTLLVSADIEPTIELTVSGSISNWVMHPPQNGEIGGVSLEVVSNGNPSYHITMADKMDQDPCGHPKPSGTAGYMTLYKNDACAGGWGYATPTNKISVAPLEIKGPIGDYIELSGTDQLLITSDSSINSQLIFFRQNLASDAKPASVYGGNGWRIIVTFTAVPN